MAKKHKKELPVPNNQGIDKYLDGLNEDQVAAFYAMRDFMYKDNSTEMFLLKGYAGTGKTFCISRIIQYVKDNPNHFKRKETAAMTAPTNKAVQVLRESATKDIKPHVSFRTVHQLLGLKEVIQENGEIVFKNSFEDYNEMTQYVMVIIDEVSMLNDELFYLIKNNSKQVKIIMMGDPAQIPPVGKVDCEPFLNPGEHKIIECTLEKIMRQKDGSKIVELGQHIRDNVLTEIDLIGRNGDDLMMHFHPDSRAETMQFFESKFKGMSFSDFGSKIKVVAWRNKKVAEYNSFIRSLATKMKSADIPRLIIGERMISNEPVIDGKSILLTTNQEFTVISFEEFMMPVETSLGEQSYKTYSTKIEFYDAAVDGMVKETIMIAHPDSDADIQSVLTKIKNAALYAPEHKKKFFWKEFYKFKRTFADVSYAYAITAHKSQGSTYDEVIVDANDIFINQNIRERNRILYTAITRAKNHALILH